MKNDWEEKDPRRAEKAKMSIKRFILEKMKKHGTKLTEEENNLINILTQRKETKDNNSKLHQ